MRSTRRAAVLGAVVLGALLAVLPASAANAADPLELSLDGTSWSTSMPDPLFASPAYAVPGDVLTSALWVRNSSGDPARIELDVVADLGVTPGTLAGDLSLSIDGTPVDGGTSWLGPELAPGSSVRIPLVVTFAASSQITSSISVAAVLEAVTLTQTGVGPPTGVPSTPGDLASTGADAGRLLAAALAVLGAGLLLVAARRRARRAED